MNPNDPLDPMMEMDMQSVLKSNSLHDLMRARARIDARIDELRADFIEKATALGFSLAVKKSKRRRTRRNGTDYPTVELASADEPSSTT